MSVRVIKAGAQEYVDTSLTSAAPSAVLGNQAVYVSYDRCVTWTAGQWIAGQGTYAAVASFLTGGPGAPMPPLGMNPITVKIVDGQETIMVDCGYLNVVAC